MNPRMNFWLLGKLSWRWRKEGVILIQINTLTTVSVNRPWFFHCCQLWDQSGRLLCSLNAHKSSLESEDTGPFIITQVTAKQRDACHTIRVCLWKRQCILFWIQFSFLLFNFLPFSQWLAHKTASVVRMLQIPSCVVTLHNRSHFSLPANNFVRGPGVKASLVPELPGPLLLQGPASEMNERIILFSWSACESRGIFL